jgi:hypothetical protein
VCCSDGHFHTELVWDEYLDGNYGGVLIVFDRLFGTYIAEQRDTPCRFGLVRLMTTYNLLTIEFDHCRALWRDLRTAHSSGEACGYVFKPPSWRPDGSGQTTEDLRRSASPQHFAEGPL